MAVEAKPSPGHVENTSMIASAVFEMSLTPLKGMCDSSYSFPEKVVPKRLSEESSVVNLTPLPPLLVPKKSPAELKLLLIKQPIISTVPTPLT